MSAERQKFERWYIANADLERNPLGGRDCDLQWRAWAASKGLNSAGFLPLAEYPPANGKLEREQGPQYSCDRLAY